MNQNQIYHNLADELTDDSYETVLVRGPDNVPESALPNLLAAGLWFYLRLTNTKKLDTVKILKPNIKFDTNFAEKFQIYLLKVI